MNFCTMESPSEISLIQLGNRHPRASARSVVHAGTTTEHLTEIILWQSKLLLSIVSKPSAQISFQQLCLFAFNQKHMSGKQANMFVAYNYFGDMSKEHA